MGNVISLARYSFAHPLQLVGSQSLNLAPVGDCHFFHPERLLHLLGRLCRPHRRDNLHSSWSRSLGRLRALLVRDLPGQLGEIRVDPLAMDPHRLHCCDVYHDHNSYWCSLWVLCRFRMHAQSLLHIIQSCSLYHQHDHIHPPSSASIQPTIWSRSGWHGGGLLYIPHHLRCDQSCSQLLQPIHPVEYDGDNDGRPWCSLYVPRDCLFHHPSSYTEPSTGRHREERWCRSPIH